MEIQNAFNELISGLNSDEKSIRQLVETSTETDQTETQRKS